MFKVIGQNLIEFAYLYLSLSIECISIQARQASIQQWKLAAPLMIDRSSSEHVYKLQFLRLNVPSCRWPCNFLETQAASELVLTCYIIESVINLFGPKWEGRSYNKHHMDKQARTSRSRTLLLPTIKDGRTGINAQNKKKPLPATTTNGWLATAAAATKATANGLGPGRPDCKQEITDRIQKSISASIGH